MRKRDEEFMAEALNEARRSLDVDEFPVGAVVVFGDEVVVRAHWTGAAQRRLLDHAELLALMAAERSGKVARRRERQEATLYTTLEPCALCMAAAMSFLLGRIVFAAEAPVDGGTTLPGIRRTACRTRSLTLSVALDAKPASNSLRSGSSGTHNGYGRRHISRKVPLASSDRRLRRSRPDARQGPGPRVRRN
jgi:tRNA(Arg) A34 adenosine deaminase TadA